MMSDFASSSSTTTTSCRHVGIHGRDREVQLLLDVYEKSKHYPSNNTTTSSTSSSLIELVLIGGRSGIGKTALVNTLGPMVQSDGFFVSGKFELSTFQEPFAVFKTAFTRYADQLLNTKSLSEQGEKKGAGVDQRVDEIRKAVQDAVGSEGKILTDMIPSLEPLIGKQEDATNIRRTKGLTRFHFIFSQFCRAVSSVAPLVLFLDDIQWSDAASLDLLEALLQSQNPCEQQSSLLVIASYRDDELQPANDDFQVLEHLSSNLKRVSGFLHRSREFVSIHVTDVRLQDLNEDATNQLVAGFLETDHQQTTDLGRIIHEACQGNPLHATQLLCLLIEKGLLSKGMPPDPLVWTWDSPKVLKTCESTETVDELIRRKLVNLPQFTLRVLQVAACMGDEIDMSAVCCVLEANISEVEISVESALREGHVVFSEHSSRHRFVHDRIRQIVLSSINDRDAFSSHIGQQLWRRSPPVYLDSKLCIVTSLLNSGGHKYLTDPADQIKVASLNLEAGTKAACLAAFPDSSRYLAAGIDLLRGVGEDHWKDEYELSLNIFSTAAETELCNQDYNRVAELTDEVFKKAHTFKDKLRAYASLISSMGQVGNLNDAIKLGIELLGQLGESLPQNQQNQSSINSEIAKTKRALRRRSSEDLVRLPPMHDANKLYAMHIMTTLLPYACQAGSSYTEIITRRLVWMFLRYGFHKGCALGFTKFGFYLCESDPKEGCRLGQVAVSIIERSGARELAPRVKLYFYGFIRHWMYPLKDSLPHLADVVKVGTKIGDIEYAMRALVHMSGVALHSGMALDLVEEKFQEATRQMIIYKQEVFLQMADAFLQYIHNLTGRAPDNRILSGKLVDFSSSNDDEATVPIVQYYHCVFGADLAFTFGDYSLASHMVEKRQSLEYRPHGHYVVALELMKEVLISVALLRQGNSNKRKNAKVARQGLERMKAWAKSCPENFLHKQLLLQAEMTSLKPPQKSARCYAQVLYDQSIRCALKEGFVQEAALACELAGNYMFRLGETKLSKDYGEKAKHLYEEWGATEKAKQLLLSQSKRKREK